MTALMAYTIENDLNCQNERNKNLGGESESDGLGLGAKEKSTGRSTDRPVRIYAPRH